LNWFKLLSAPVIVVLFLIYIPLYNTLIADLFVIIDNSNNVLFGSLIKLGFGFIPFMLVILFFYSVITAFYEPSPISGRSSF